MAEPSRLSEPSLTDLLSRNTVCYMKRDSKLSGVLHILLHMAELDEPVTSDDLSKIMDTNPVVVRRLMAGLREQQYVLSVKGHGGGWTLACELADVTLLDIYEAVGSPRLLAMGNRTEAPGCLVEQSVNAALGKTFDEAEQRLLRRLGEVTLASLSADCHQRLNTKGISIKAKRNRHGLQS
ncbi:conserved hypothetical protein [Rhodopirellula baltica SH 1]|uniref:Uncharacterized protein n=2 Tax=Rhodopirellula baltica TaxID=265606 RepID=Q7UTU3_RHOBA|nr:conserved hypothetical protein [Rhodopirellula baltica SH 1]